MKFRSIVDVHFEDHTKHVSKLREHLVLVQMVHITIVLIQWINMKKI
jgi:hypothetical protein